LRSQLEDPTENERRNKTDDEQNHNAPWQPIGCAEHREHGARNLGEQPCADQIQSGRADDVPALQFIEEAASIQCCFSWQSF